jgi:MFS transporter, ACS family, hexuronate transporter
VTGSGPKGHPADRYRWLALGLFVLSTAINYLDRATLATLAPAVRAEFHLTNAQYGWIVNAFLLTYTLAAPFAGMLVDVIGLNRAAILAVALWSCAGIATGLSRGVAGLAACRAVLGVAEAAGIPAAGKAIHQLLKPAERALGNAANQSAVSLGMVLAPPIATAIFVRAGWRAAFIATGIVGLLWIPLWLKVGQTLPSADPIAGRQPMDLLRDRRLWLFVLANALSMIPYSLWVNFTTLYFTDARHLTLVQAAWYAWIPPVLAAAGGVLGGWLSLRWIHSGVDPADARRSVCLTASILALATFAIPFAPTPALAAAGISLSWFAVAAFSVNMYSLPLDIYGGPRAAFAVSMLTASAGASGLISPAFGWLIDLHGYKPVIAIAAVCPLLASAVLSRTQQSRDRKGAVC